MARHEAFANVCESCEKNARLAAFAWIFRKIRTALRMRKPTANAGFRGIRTFRKRQDSQTDAKGGGMSFLDDVLTCDRAETHGEAYATAPNWNALAGKFPPASEPEPSTDLDSAPPLPSPWDVIRGRIQAGWRAEFGPPGPDGRQAITWIPPGAWESEGADQGEPEPNTAKPFRNSYENPAQPVRCGDCRHQEPTGHPALIRCGAGVQASGACGLWWSTDRHQCGRFESATVNVNFVNNDS
jgi:hypothetical protein